MINPDEYFSKGSSGHEMTSQAVAEINRARDAGLTVEADRLESNLKAAIITLQNSGGKDTNGFTTMIKSIGGLAPQIEGVAKQKDETNQVAGRLKANIEIFKSKGGTFTPEQVSAISEAAEIGNKDVLNTYNDFLANEIKSLSANNQGKDSSGKAKDQIKPVDLTEFEQQRIFDIAAMKGKTEEELKDPAVYGELAQEVKKRDMVETQARKIFRRLGAARELLTNAEAMNEFGDSMPTNWVQRFFATGDDALQASLLGQLKGGDLSQGMAEMKAATGTAAGMAVEETKALANSISALNTDLNYKDAQKKLKQVIDDAKFALGRLGVDPLTYNDKKASDRVMSNQEKYLFRDERDYQNKRVPTSGSGSLSTQRLGELTRQGLPMSTKITEGNETALPEEPFKFALPE